MTDQSAGMAALREALTGLRTQSPALGRQLEGVEIGALLSRADLARVPVLRKSDLAARQRAAPPFGGLAAIEAGRFHVIDPALALNASGGALFAVIHAQLVGERSEQADVLHAEGVLRSFGLDRIEAGEIARRPLPEPTQPAEEQQPD